MIRNSTDKTTIKRGLLKVKKCEIVSINLNCNMRNLKVLNEINLSLTDQQYLDPIIHACFQKATQAQFKSLNFERNQEPRILTEIVHINFLKLRILELPQNRIENIQVLVWIKAPYLRTLNLSQNCIISSQPLSKIYQHNISQLKLGNNYFNHLEALSRMKFSSNITQRDLFISKTQSMSVDKKAISNVNFLFKMYDSENICEQCTCFNNTRDKHWCNGSHQTSQIA